MKNTGKGTKGGSVSAQPMDPTKNGEDFIGDTTGLTGITTGSAQKTSATPNDTQQDQNKDHLPGGILESQPNDGSHGRLSPNINVDDDQETLDEMSPTARKFLEDVASEDDVADFSPREAHTNPDEVPYTVNVKNASGDDSPNSDEINTESAPYQQPENLGEQSVSGSAPDPTADDDTLEVAHAAGMQLKEPATMDHPKPVSIADDVDEAEVEHLHS